MHDTFLANLFRMKHIDRWGLMYNTQKENLSEHSFECALLTHYLAIIGNTHFGRQYNPDKLACRALFHDATETLTGDLPTPVKYYNQEISDVFHDIEAKAAGKILTYLPEDLRNSYQDYLNGDALNEDEHALLSAADKLCAYIKCVQELKAGNNEFVVAHKTILASLNANPLPEVQYFMANVAKSFAQSLDELQGYL